MYTANIVDLGDQLEIIGYHQQKEIPKRKENTYQMGFTQTQEWENSMIEKNLEVRAAENRFRAERRAKTKIRRVCRRFQLKYMWTLTIADPVVNVVNPTNKKITQIDAGNLEHVWNLWKLFLQRARKDGVVFNYIVTIELQEKRLRNRGERVYHFHFATDKPLAQNKKIARRSGHDRYVEKYWTFGHVKATKKKSSKNMANVYLMKYISKTFDETQKGKQRYRIKEGLLVPKYKITDLYDSKQVRNFAEGHGKIVQYFQIELDNAFPVHWYLLEKLE